jgi:hypothetical protein
LKLSDNYAPERCEREPNTLFAIYNAAIVEGTRDAPDPDDARHQFDNDRYGYELRDDERAFFRDMYVTSGDEAIQRVPAVVALLQECAAVNPKVGENEKDLLDFVDDQQHLTRVLLAPVGRGKSTLLRYFFHYLVPTSRNLCGRVIPIHLVMDRFAAELSNCATPAEITSWVQGTLVRERVQQAVASAANLDDETLWTYIKRLPGFASLAQAEQDLQRIYPQGSPERQVEILKRRMAAKDHRDFPFAVARYLTSVRGKRIVLIFDNMDLLPLSLAEVLLALVPQWTSQWGLRVIIPMRRSTYSRLNNNSGTVSAAVLGLRTIRWRDRDAKEYLKQRTTAIAALVPSESRVTHTQGPAVVEQQDHEGILRAMFDLVLHHHEVLEHLASGNLRKLSYLFRRYLACARIDEDRLKRAVFLRRTAGTADYRLRLNVVLTAFLTGNHKTLFSQSEEMRPLHDCLINLYCNGQSHVNGRLIRLHILRMLKPAEEHGGTAYREIADTYWGWIEVARKGKVQRADCDEAVTHAVRRLMECNLVDTPDHYRIDGHSSLDGVRGLRRTQAGTYYLLSFRNYFEYLQYMKDDVDFEDETHGLRDCIAAPTREQQYVEVRRFLDLLWKEEYAFLEALPFRMRSDFAAQMRRAERELFVAAAPASKMIEFGQQRDLPRAEVAAYEELVGGMTELEGRLLRA